MIDVNGRKVEWVENENVKDLLKRIRYTFPLVIVKIDDNIIPRKDFLTVTITDNSKVEVIHMTSGG